MSLFKYAPDSTGSKRLRLVRHLAVAVLPLVVAATAACAATTTVIAAYVFPRDKTLAPGEVDARKITRVNYAFANIDHGRMVEGTTSDAANFGILNGLKRDNPQLTVLVSVGGWEWSGKFSDMASTKASRAIFIESVAEFITRYQLDGLDIDWEYPGMAGSTNHFKPEDKENYTLLVKELRERFDLMQSKANRRLYITVAAGASTEFLQHTEMAKVQKYVNTVNLMAYDYYEPGDQKITGNHAPLFTDPADPEGISADRSIEEFERSGVPAAKLVLGVPFYGHVWGQVAATNNGLFQPGHPVANAFSNYAAIASTMLGQGYTRYWDQAASVPYLYNAQKQIFVSYEDPESLSFKCKYVLSHRLAGMMFWDYGSDPSGVLLDAIDGGLQPAPDAQPARKTGSQ